MGSNPVSARKTVAVMQPYFFPYAGYFRLLAAADHFVILDCVQFPRRGRVHRCQVPTPDGGERWLTLPLAAQARSILIRDLEFAGNARAALDERLAEHPWLAAADGPAASLLRAHLHGPLLSVPRFLEDGTRLVAGLLGLPATISRSSDLDISPALRGQQRIIAIAKAVGATDYLNSPGGRELYDSEDFSAAGLSLHFLPDYRGPHRHMLKSLVTVAPEVLRDDIFASCRES